MKCTFILFFLLVQLGIYAQKMLPKIQVLDSGHKTSLRGISPVSNNVIWVSGSKGQVGKSLNGGQTWQWITVKGFENKDFRDIEAFSAQKAIIMCVDKPAYILKTTDGGNSWKVVYEDNSPGIFLDAMAFWNDQSGIVIGDPINNKVIIRRTFNGGDSWRGLPENNYPIADSAEAMFASSGSNIGLMGSGAACFVTGGNKARFFYKDKIVPLPLIQGTESTGANSVSVVFKKRNVEKIMVVGGDFNNPTNTTNNCTFSIDNGNTWQQPTTNPLGYRSCVEHININQWISCGITGVDVSQDGGLNWAGISNIGFHACKKAKKGNAIFLCGTNGRIARVDF
jgi:hypothetical protein